MSAPACAPAPSASAGWLTMRDVSAAAATVAATGTDSKGTSLRAFEVAARPCTGDTALGACKKVDGPGWEATPMGACEEVDGPASGPSTKHTRRDRLAGGSSR